MLLIFFFPVFFPSFLHLGPFSPSPLLSPLRCPSNSSRGNAEGGGRRNSSQQEPPIPESRIQAIQHSTPNSPTTPPTLNSQTTVESPGRSPLAGGPCAPTKICYVHKLRMPICVLLRVRVFAVLSCRRVMPRTDIKILFCLHFSPLKHR